MSKSLKSDLLIYISFHEKERSMKIDEFLSIFLQKLFFSPVFHFIPLLFSNQNGAGFAALERADNAASFQLIHNSCRAAVAELEFSLQNRGGSLSAFNNNFDCCRQHFIFFPVGIGCGGFFAFVGQLFCIAVNFLLDFLIVFEI